MADVEITLDGDTITLRCTPGAMRALCRQHGDLDTCLSGVRRMSTFMQADVVQAGIGPKAFKEMKISREVLEDEIYNAGVVDLIAPLTNFLLMLANGGRNLAAAGGEGEEGEAPGPNRD